MLLLLLITWTEMNAAVGKTHSSNEIHCLLTLQLLPIITNAQQLVSENHPTSNTVHHKIKFVLGNLTTPGFALHSFTTR